MGFFTRAGALRVFRKVEPGCKYRNIKVHVCRGTSEVTTPALVNTNEATSANFWYLSKDTCMHFACCFARAKVHYATSFAVMHSALHKSRGAAVDDVATEDVVPEHQLDAWRDEDRHIDWLIRVTQYQAHNKDYQADGKRRQLLCKRFDGFLHLPPEIRNRVYELLLVKKKIFIANKDTRHHGYHGVRVENFYDRYKKDRYRYIDWPAYIEEPKKRGITAGLLRGVSLKVHEEAHKIFWGPRNQFIFPAGSWNFPYYPMAPRMLHAKHPLINVKDLSMAIDKNCLHHGTGGMSETSIRQTCLESIQAQLPLGRLAEDLVTPHDLRERIHDARRNIQQFEITSTWEDFQSWLSLKRLQVDIEECYCPTGCCRQVQYAFKQGIMLGPWVKGQPGSIEISGWKDEAERACITRYLTHDAPEPFQEHKVHFLGQSIYERGRLQQQQKG